MPLHLVAREVAHLNVENLDKLGAFNCAKECRYHYSGAGVPPGCGCAIGIADPGGLLIPDDDGIAVEILVRMDTITCSADDRAVLTFIQEIHDQIVASGVDSVADGDNVRGHLRCHIPPAVQDLVGNAAVFDKETYRAIMQRLATS